MLRPAVSWCWKPRAATSAPRIGPWRAAVSQPGRGVPAAIVNPKRVRDFARGIGLEAKTDRVDARLIARYGEVMRPAATPLPDPARLELREILAIGPVARSTGGMSAELTRGAS